MEHLEKIKDGLKQMQEEMLNSEISMEKRLKQAIKKSYAKNGTEVINPFKILKLNKKHKYEDYLKADIKVLVDCVALINIKNKGWEKSKGAKLERHIARALKIDIYNSVDAFIKDLKVKENK